MPTLAQLPYALTAGVAIALGASFGSFLNVVIYRLPRGQSVVHPGSACPRCGKSIRGYDNIPLLSWLLLRGKSRCCASPIPARYPLVEALGGLLAWAILEALVLIQPPETVWWKALLIFSLYLTLGLGLLAAAFIDLDHMYLPDGITLGGALLGLLSIPVREISLLESALGGTLGFLIVWLPFVVIYQRLRGHAGMGLGDAKLLLLGGAWFGWQGAVFSLLAGAVQGTLITLVVFVARGKIEEPEAVRLEREALEAEILAAEGEEKARLARELAEDPIGEEPGEGLGAARVPFGPFLILAMLEYMLFGPQLAELLAGL